MEEPGAGEGLPGFGPGRPPRAQASRGRRSCDAYEGEWGGGGEGCTNPGTLSPGARKIAALSLYVPDSELVCPRTRCRVFLCRGHGSGRGGRDAHRAPARPGGPPAAVLPVDWSPPSPVTDVMCVAVRRDRSRAAGPPPTPSPSPLSRPLVVHMYHTLRVHYTPLTHECINALTSCTLIWKGGGGERDR